MRDQHNGGSLHNRPQFESCPTLFAVEAYKSQEQVIVFPLKDEDVQIANVHTTYIQLYEKS